MSTLLSGLLAGGWPFLVGWVFPSALSLSIFAFTLAAAGEDLPALSTVSQLGLANEALTVVVGAVVLALVLSAVQTVLYRLLEGYYFPARLRAARERRHQQKRKALREHLKRAVTEASKAAGHSVQQGLVTERLRRYPVDDDQIAPTRLANAIRAFETYAWHHFCLDSQALWSELVSVVSETTRAEQERARAGVDFFVALTYLSALGGAASILIGFLDPHHPLGLVLAGAVSLLLTPLWYGLAVRSTDNWYTTVQALVNLGRKPLAESLNLALPNTIQDEREMWRRVGWLVKERYNPQVSELLAPFSANAKVPPASNAAPPPIRANLDGPQSIPSSPRAPSG